VVNSTLKAPAPKAPDGHPDLSGLWRQARPNVGNLKGNGKGKAAPARAPGEPPAAQFGNLGAGFENGLPYTEWGRKTRDERKGNNSKDNPDANCLPLGPSLDNLEERERGDCRWKALLYETPCPRNGPLATAPRGGFRRVL